MYKFLNGKQTMYFCNEHHFVQWNTSHIQYTRVYDLLEDIFGYKPNNSLLRKELAIALDKYGAELVADYLFDNKNDIERAMAKDFKNEWVQSKYFMAILTNNMGKYLINRTKKDYEKPVSETVMDYGEHKYKRVRKKSLMEVMEELNSDE